MNLTLSAFGDLAAREGELPMQLVFDSLCPPSPCGAEIRMMRPSNIVPDRWRQPDWLPCLTQGNLQIRLARQIPDRWSTTRYFITIIRAMVTKVEAIIES